MIEGIVENIIPGIMFGCIYALIGVGFILIRKTSGVFNLAQGHIVITGPYLYYYIAITLGISIWLSLVFTIVLGIIFGFLIERTIIKPLYGYDLNASILVTMSLAILIEMLLSIGWGTEFLVAPRMFPRDIIFQWRSVTVSYDQFAIFACTMAIFLAINIFFARSRLGIAMMAVSEDTVSAQSLGIKVSRLVGASWGLACSLSFLAGILITNISGISYTMSEIGIKAIAVAIIGGFESFGGLLLAGIIVGVGEALAVAYLDPYMPGGSLREILAFVLMLFVLLYTPNGLFGWARIERV